MRLISGFLILLVLLYLGTLASAAGVPVPGSVLGMLLMAGALHLRLIRLSWVRPAADLMIRHMALFFVPPGVGMMVHFELIRAEWLPITVAGLFSTLAVMVTVGFLQSRMEGNG